ncbi:MAG: hypothetical protein HRT38_19965 [Alteromonadaceae bacterium]|nr:hypothetical protein [Alteromonadaceae bacterium]
MAQAAINVELFTIPLYMTALYSIQGTHQINSENSTLYTGRWWPGSAPTAGKNLTTNQQVFNKVYSVFIEEMLHLQLTSNVASTLGFMPIFTSEALQTDQYGWKCYESGISIIPHILDFKDWKTPDEPSKSDLSKMTVELRAMNEIQINLFLAIEETENSAHDHLNNCDITISECITRKKYFECAPFDWFTSNMTETNLPLFGSISHMYWCYWSYLEIEYSDNTSLLQRLTSIQRDQFTNKKSNQVNKQYPDIYTTIGETQLTPPELDDLKAELFNNLQAITIQGEGGRARTDNMLEMWKNKSWVKKKHKKKSKMLALRTMDQYLQNFNRTQRP